MIILERLAELKYRNNLLFRLGLFHFIIFFLLIIPLMIDPREVMGINTWIKPMKFALSIGIYAWTFGWIMFDLSNQQKWVYRLSVVIGITMLIEIFIILYQASRATASHFNFSTSFDSILFATMGIMIGLNVVVTIIVLLLFLFSKTSLDKAYLLAIRIGLVIFLLGNYAGKVMIDNMAHSVNVPDGGPGIPFLNWSMEGGDLRVAHFMGLHAIQILPLFAFWLKSRTQMPIYKRLVFVAVLSILYAAVFSMLYVQASKGIPLIPLQ